jgi:hypothetical protein
MLKLRGQPLFIAGTRRSWAKRFSFVGLYVG